MSRDDERALLLAFVESYDPTRDGSNEDAVDTFLNTREPTEGKEFWSVWTGLEAHQHLGKLAFAVDRECRPLRCLTPLDQGTWTTPGRYSLKAAREDGSKSGLPEWKP